MYTRQLACGVSLALVAACTGGSRADNTPYEATVTAAEVEVHSGPSKEMYATSKLRQGEKVTVLKEEQGGWLAIKPPPGSFSWVNTRFIELNTNKTTGRVLGDDVPVRIGSELRNEPPTVESKSKLKRGAQVVVLDTKEAYGPDGGWLPIAPTPEEFRYIPGDAVKGTPRVQTVNATPTPVAQPAPTPAPPIAPTPIAPNADDGTLWQQAQQAEQAGNMAEAADLYLTLARRTQDHNLSMRCHNRVYFLRQGQRSTPPQATQTSIPNRATYPANTAQRRIQPRPNYNQPQFQPASRVRQQPAPPPVRNNAAAYRGSGPGRLEKAPFFVDNLQAYVLVSSAGQPRLYITPQPGVNLEPYVYRNVELYGNVVYRGDLRTNYMKAQQIRPLP